MSPEAKPAALLVLNAGSSSLKFAVFGVTGRALAQRYDGQMEGIGAAPHFILRDAAGAMLTERRFTETQAPKGHEGALFLGGAADFTEGELRVDAQGPALGVRLVSRAEGRLHLAFTNPAMAQPAVAALLRDGESDQMHAA